MVGIVLMEAFSRKAEKNDHSQLRKETSEPFAYINGVEPFNRVHDIMEYRGLHSKIF